MAFANSGLLRRLRTYQALSLLLAGLSLAWSAGAQIILSDYTTNAPLKVMAIGDSITDDCSYNGAWRFYLQPLLQSNGYAFTFVGRQSSNPTRTFTEKRHEGYCGAVIATPGVMPDPVHGYAGTNVYLLKIIADALTNMTPDLVLVVMGANDIGRARNPFYVATNDMAHLLDLILSNAPAANIVLTKTTTLSNAIIGYATNASNVPVYNAALQAFVNKRAASGQRISCADMFSAVDYSTMFNPDHLHPNPTGLKSMANEFLTRIELITARSNPLMATLVPGGAIWRYSDKGQDLGTNWALPQYDDTAWSSGPGRLGYGDSVAATTIQYGTDANQKNPTTYFRYSFIVPEGVAFTNLNFRLSRQDGAVVWLNGQEVFRVNMTNGPITYSNQALKRVTGDATYIFYPTNLTVPFLPAGTNVIAVELHSSSPTISSLGFDMELLGTGYSITTPSLSARVKGNGVALSWLCANGISYSLFSSSALDQPSAWTPEPTTVQTNGVQCVVSIPFDSGPRFFRLQKQ